METGIPLNEDITLYVEPAKKKGLVTYTFKQGSTVITEKDDEMPVKLSNMGYIAKEIKKYLDPHGEFKTEKINTDYDKIKLISQAQYETIKINNEELKELEDIENQRKIKKNLENAKKELELLTQPLLYIASHIEWKTAGERNNILLAFIVYASQVILRNPISLIGLGEGSSGKTHVQEVGLFYIPNELIVNEKDISPAAMFNRAKENPYFYDGKIVNYGDLGGLNDQDDIIRSKNLLKELHSEGYLNKPLSIKEDGDWVTRDLTLFGKPCLTYTTIPNHSFDDQEKSRSLFITPRMDNKVVFNKMKTALEMRGKTFKQMKEYEKQSELIKYMVLHLRSVFEEVKIVNPYVSFVVDFLSESEYFKRDFDKYNGILKTISALNFYNKTVHEVNDEKIIYTSLEDVQLFFSLLKPYHSSIQFNISPKSSEVLNEFKENIEDWGKYYSKRDYEDDADLDNYGLTINDYSEKSKINISKRSLRTYFSELNNNGFLKVVGNKGNAPVWNLVEDIEDIETNDLFELDDNAVNNIVYELGEDVKDAILCDEPIDDLNVGMHYDDILVPPWNKYDNKKHRISKKWG